MRNQVVSQQETQLGSQMIFDICLNLSSIKNISQNWTPRFNFSLYFQLQGSSDPPCPYQIVTAGEKQNWNSNIDLNCYNSGPLSLGPMQQKFINEICTFRCSAPIKIIDEIKFVCFMDILVQDKLITTLKYEFDSGFGLSSYVPIFQLHLGIAVQTKIETQILGIRTHNNYQNDSNQDIFKFIQNVFHQDKRLTKKINTITQNIQAKAKIQQKLQQLQEKTQKQTQDNQNNQQSMTMTEKVKQQQQEPLAQQNRMHQNEQEVEPLYKQYNNLRNYKQSRIFKGKPKKQHRSQLINFIKTIKQQKIKNLQVGWQNYLNSLTKETISKQILQLKSVYVSDFAYEIKSKLLRKNILNSRSQCNLQIGKVNMKIEGFKLNRIIDQFDTDFTQQSFNMQLGGDHLVVLVHGYGASSLAMSLIQRALKFYFPQLLILNSKSNQLPQDSANIQQMGRNLAMQIEQTLQSYPNGSQFELSFICHSLGGLIARSALTHLQVFKYNMNSFITLSTPHLGHLSHKNKLAKFGMLALNKWHHSNVIDELLMRDSSDERLAYLYTLSLHSGLSWFKNVRLYGAKGDGYVGINSALVAQVDASFGNKIVKQMANNLAQLLKNTKTQKTQVQFKHQRSYTPDFSQLLVGRSSHIAFSTHQHFITLLVLSNEKYFKYQKTQIYDNSF